MEQKKENNYVVIDDLRFEAQAELTAALLEQMDGRKKLRRARSVVYGYYIGSFALAGASLVHTMSSDGGMSIADSLVAVALAFVSGSLVFTAGRLLHTMWVMKLEQDISSARRKAKRVEKDLQPLLGVVQPR